MIVPLGKVIEGCKSDGSLGIDDRTKIIDCIERGIEIASYKSTYNPWLATIDVRSDHRGVVTLPSFVGTVLAVNVGGSPTIFRNDWYNWHINGFGDCCGQSCGHVTDMAWSPIFQDLTEWAVLAAICEDATDGNGSKVLNIRAECMDAQGNIKDTVTIPPTGASVRGLQIPLLVNTANTDPAVTYVRAVHAVTKPVTRGYVKLIAFPIRQMALAVTLGYYGPNETNPTYRRIRIGAQCQCARIKFRRASIALVDDTDIVPISSYQAILDLVKSVQLSDANNIPGSEAYLAKAVRLLGEVQTIESGGTWSPMQIAPDFGIGTIDYR